MRFRRPARDVAALLACAAGLLLAARASAAPAVVASLGYDASAGAGACPDAAGFRTSVERQLHYDPFRADADRHVAVEVIRTDTGFDGRIRWSDASGRALGDRKLSTHHPDCTDLVNHLAFPVAVQLQLLATFAPAALAPAEVPPPAVPVPATPPAAPPDRVALAVAPSPPPAPSSPGRRLRLSAGLGPSLALAPRPTPVGRLFVDGRWSWFSLELAIDGAWPVTRQAQDGSGFSLDRFGGAVTVCGHARALAACATGALAHLEARGFGVDVRRATTGMISEVGARLVATHALGARFFAAAGLEGLILLSRCTVTLNDVAAWTTPRV